MYVPSEGVKKVSELRYVEVPSSLFDTDERMGSEPREFREFGVVHPFLLTEFPDLLSDPYPPKTLIADFPLFGTGFILGDEGDLIVVFPIYPDEPHFVARNPLVAGEIGRVPDAFGEFAVHFLCEVFCEP